VPGIVADNEAMREFVVLPDLDEPPADPSD
jgi:hypothetical protein